MFGNQMQCRCCTTTPATGTLKVCANLCSHPADAMTATITQTAGGTYSASQSGPSCLSFLNVPVGTYTVVTSVPNSPSNTTIGVVVTASTITTVTINFSPPAGFNCSCCPGRFTPDVLHVSTGIGSGTISHIIGTSWSSLTLSYSYPGFDCLPTNAPMTLTIDALFNFNCGGLSVSWRVHGTNGLPGGPPNGNCPSVCAPCTVPTGCTDVFASGGMSPVAPNTPLDCTGPLNLTFTYTDLNTTCPQAIGPITVTE